MKILKTFFIVIVNLLTASSTSLSSNLASESISSTEEKIFSQRLNHFDTRDHRLWNQVCWFKYVFLELN